MCSLNCSASLCCKLEVILTQQPLRNTHYECILYKYAVILCSKQLKLIIFNLYADSYKKYVRSII